MVLRRLTLVPSISKELERNAVNTYRVKFRFDFFAAKNDPKQLQARRTRGSQLPRKGVLHASFPQTDRFGLPSSPRRPGSHHGSQARPMRPRLELTLIFLNSLPKSHITSRCRCSTWLIDAEAWGVESRCCAIRSICTESWDEKRRIRSGCDGVS